MIVTRLFFWGKLYRVRLIAQAVQMMNQTRRKQWQKESLSLVMRARNLFKFIAHFDSAAQHTLRLRVLRFELCKIHARNLHDGRNFDEFLYFRRA